MGPYYQDNAVFEFLRDFNGDLRRFKCVCCRDLTFSQFLIYAAIHVVATPTLPRKRKISNMSSMTMSLPGKARPLRFRYVFPYSLLLPVLPCPFSCARLTVNVQTVAGIVSLLNDFRVSRHGHPLGFLNYLLYGVGSAGLNDIKIGSNPGCGTEGFSAGPGWDPVCPARLRSLHSMLTDFVLLRSRV